MAAPDIIELYRFARGAEVWRYTSGDTIASHDGQDYHPEAISRTADEQGAEINRSPIEITLPQENPVAAQFIGYAPEQLMAVTVYRQIGDVTAVIWQGRVVGCNHEAHPAVLQCESVFTSLRRAGLQARYQVNCRHFLYDAGCRIDPELYRDEVTIAGVMGLQITSPALADKPDGWYTAGHVLSASGAARMILAHSGDAIVITAPIHGLAVSDALSVFAGCPHSVEACAGKFNNLINYGGFPWVPQINPFGGGAIA